MSDFQRKCPLCSGEMIRSQRPSGDFWKMPWKSSFLPMGGERIYPWACMSCGVVLLYLDRLPAIAEEYKQARDKGEKEPSRQIAPEPLKS